jgi:hypothetical protein
MTNDQEYDRHRQVTWEADNENYCVRNCDYIKTTAVKINKQTPLTLGVFPRRSKQTTLEMFTRLGRYLSYDLGRTVIVQAEKTFEEFWKNVSQDKYDIVHFNQYQYIKSHHLYEYKIIAKNEERGSDTITPAILVRNTKEITLSNACKFTNNGTVTLTAKIISTENNDWINIDISDTGIGIDKEDTAKLFLPFSQIDNSSTRRVDGSGLGLIISKHFCELMGGTIKLESQINLGSTFTIQFPATVQQI